MLSCALDSFWSFKDLSFSLISFLRVLISANLESTSLSLSLSVNISLDRESNKSTAKLHKEIFTLRERLTACQKKLNETLDSQSKEIFTLRERLNEVDSKFANIKDLKKEIEQKDKFLNDQNESNTQLNTVVQKLKTEKNEQNDAIEKLNAQVQELQLDKRNQNETIKSLLEIIQKTQLGENPPVNEANIQSPVP